MNYEKRDVSASYFYFMRIPIFISILISFSAFGQDTTLLKTDCLHTQEMRTVQVVELLIRRITPLYTLIHKERIEEMQANDVGEILQKIEGVNLKSYGGLGGLKTISVRSLGSEHSAISVDGFSLQNSQTGQVNLSQIQTNNIESITFGVGENSGWLLPVSAQIAGNNVSIQTFEMTPIYSADSVQIRANTRLGSFGQISGYAAAKVKIKKGFVSGFGNYRTANGLYNYQLQNGAETIVSSRTNNDYTDGYFGGVVGYEWKNQHQLRVSYKQSKIDQGLPGAVIFYNNSADERLSTDDQTITADVRFPIGEGIYIRAYANGNLNSMRYADPTYFNSAGFVDVTYFNRSLTAGLSASGHVVKDSEHKYNRGFYFGAEGGLSDLSSTDSLFSNPSRQQASAIVGTRLDFGWIKFAGHLSGQVVHESNQNGSEGKDVIGVNPYASLESRDKGPFYIRHRLWYRNSLRVPTFNELYYSNIGNNELNPERANQFGYNLSLTPLDRNSRVIMLTAAGYFNQITDKIVAVPTQNLFTWSIQNVGIVHALGGDVSANVRWPFGNNHKWLVNSVLNYSFQRSIDRTDSNHPTFGHQIAYIPMHTGNADLSLSYKKIGVNVTNYLVSKRYSLNENNSSNEIEGFVITDFSVFYKFEFKKKQSLRIQAQVKNAFDNSYSYIRSFVMPGRNYLISLSYAFN